MSPLRFTRRTLLAGAASSTLLPLVPAAAKAPSLNFISVGDWGRGGAEKQREVGLQMGKSAAEIDSKFVISVGDNFYEDGVAGLRDPQWVDSFEKIYAEASLQTPWDVILGNHDYRGDVQAQIEYSNSSHRWRMPARYFTRSEALADGTLIDFIYIDTSPFLKIYHGTNVRVDDQDTNAQLVWLDGVLGRSQAKWKIVVGHHGVHTVTGGKRDWQELIAQVKPILIRHGVKVYVNGHDHNFQVLDRDGIQWITNGAGSQTEKGGPAAPGQFTSASHGFMAAEVTAERFAYRLIDETGAVVYTGSVAV